MRKQLCRIAVMCCVLILGAMLFLSKTYAWGSGQQARNDIYGYGTDKIPVVLLKQEKLADGTLSGKRLPNTAFYLYRADGTQVGGRYLTDENGEIHVRLNLGEYYFEEITPAPGYSFDVDENGVPVERYPFVVTSEESCVYVQAANLPLKGDLLIRKTVENADGAPLSSFQKNLEFVFSVNFSEAGSYSYLVDGTPAGELQSGDQLTLKHGQTAAFEDLPAGMLYSVIEQTPTGYIVSSSGHQGNIGDSQSVAAFVNTVDPAHTGTLTVSKLVKGGGADPDETFEFTITIDGQTESFALRSGESKAFHGLAYGSDYCVTEADSADPSYKALVHTYQGEITGPEIVELPFVNVYAPQGGSLTITKEVRGEASDATERFEFEISFRGETTLSRQVFTLTDGESITFRDLPIGTSYTVEEKNDQIGYYASTVRYSGTIASEENLVLPFINHYVPRPGGDTGSLTVSKSVVGEAVDRDREFLFAVSFIDDNSTRTEEFTLRADDKKTFEGIAHGVRYIVVEKENNTGYTSAVQVVQGTIVGDENTDVSMVNIAPEASGPETGALAIMKKVVGTATDENRVFRFDVAFDGPNAPANASFSLMDGESVVFDEIPVGVTYKVSETDAAGYEALLDSAEGTIVSGETANILFTNRASSEEPPVENVLLTVTKHVVGIVPEPNRTFVFTLWAGEWSETFYLADGESAEFWLPKGTPYVIQEEDYTNEGYNQSIVNGSGVAVENTEVVVTNTYVSEELIEISGEKTWVFPDTVVSDIPARITVSLMNSETVIADQIVEPDEHGRWTYAFTVPKYNADGTEAEYSVREAKVPGFRASYDGYNIVNTYIPPDSPMFPVITKHVMGTYVPDTEFWFVLRGMDGAPMPDSADGNLAVCSVVGEGQTTFGQINFSAPGEYSYLVYEVEESRPGWTYDTAIFSITFKVTESGDELHSVYEILRDNSPVEMIEFLNRYEEVDLSEMIILSGEKIWNHGDNPAENRPDHVNILIYGDNKLLHEITVTQEDGWEYSVELPKYDANGNEILYTVDETDVAGYSKIINGYVIINTYQSDGFGDSDKPEVPGFPDEPQGPLPGSPDGPGTPDDVPKTGDSSQLMLWISIMGISIFGLTATLLFGRKPRSRRNYADSSTDKRLSRSQKRAYDYWDILLDEEDDMDYFASLRKHKS